MSYVVWTVSVAMSARAYRRRSETPKFLTLSKNDFGPAIVYFSCYLGVLVSPHTSGSSGVMSGVASFRSNECRSIARRCASSHDTPPTLARRRPGGVELATGVEHVSNRFCQNLFGRTGIFGVELEFLVRTAVENVEKKACCQRGRRLVRHV